MSPGRRGNPLRNLALEDGLLLAAVVLLPWAFGGVEIWAYRSAALLLVSAAAVSWIKRGRAGLGLNRDARWLLPALLLGLWGVFQVLPLPPVAIETLSPAADAIYRDAFPGYPGPAPAEIVSAVEDRAIARVPEVSGLPAPARELDDSQWVFGGRWSGWRSLSLLPSAGIERLHWYFALLLGFLVVRHRAADPDVGQAYMKALFALFAGLAVFGLIYAATSNGKLYWVRSTIDPTRPFGPYVNPSNFAGVMEMGVPWIVGYTLMNLREWGRVSWLGLRTPIFAAGALLCIVADIATASKSSPFLLAGSLLLLAVMAVRKRWLRFAVLASSLPIAGIAYLVLRNAALGERIREYVDITGGDPTNAGRLMGWKSTVGMVRDYAIVGSGFGSFRDVVAFYRPPGDHLRWAQAHNDYLEVLTEGGAVAALLVLWLMWGFWSRALRPAVLRIGGRWNLEALGLLLGIAALSVHAAFDFNHQIPGNALLFVTLAGILAARYPGPGAGRSDSP